MNSSLSEEGDDDSETDGKADVVGDVDDYVENQNDHMRSPGVVVIFVVVASCCGEKDCKDNVFYCDN